MNGAIFNIMTYFLLKERPDKKNHCICTCKKLRGAFLNREEYFSRPVETAPLYLIDYKRTEKIVRPLPGELKKERE